MPRKPTTLANFPTYVGKYLIVDLTFVVGVKYHTVLAPSGRFDRYGVEVQDGYFIEDGKPIPKNGRIIGGFVHKETKKSIGDFK